MVSIIGRKIPTTNIDGAQAGGLGDVFGKFAQILSDPLSPAIKREKLMEMNRQNVETQGFMDQLRTGSTDYPGMAAAAAGAGISAPNLQGYNTFSTVNRFGPDDPRSTTSLTAEGKYHQTPAYAQKELANRLAIESAKPYSVFTPEGVQTRTVGEATSQRLTPALSLTDAKGTFMQGHASTPEAIAALPESARSFLGPGGVHIDQRAQGAFEQTYGTGKAKEALETEGLGNSAIDSLQKISRLKNMLQQVKTGTLAPALATVGAFAKSLGVDPASIGIDPNLPITAQAVPAITGPLLASMIGPGGFPANNFSEQDRNFLERIFPRISNLPEANDIILDVITRSKQREWQKSQQWDRARGQGQSFEQFDREWRMTNKPDLFADYAGRFSGDASPPSQAFGVRAPSSAAPQAGPTREEIDAELARRANPPGAL